MQDYELRKHMTNLPPGLYCLEGVSHSMEPTGVESFLLAGTLGVFLIKFDFLGWVVTVDSRSSPSSIVLFSPNFLMSGGGAKAKMSFITVRK